jgi:hypothetical protein
MQNMYLTNFLNVSLTWCMYVHIYLFIYLCIYLFTLMPTGSYNTKCPTTVCLHNIPTLLQTYRNQSRICTAASFPFQQNTDNCSTMMQSTSLYLTPLTAHHNKMFLLYSQINLTNK